MKEEGGGRERGKRGGVSEREVGCERRREMKRRREKQRRDRKREVGKERGAGVRESVRMRGREGGMKGHCCSYVHNCEYIQMNDLS